MKLILVLGQLLMLVGEGVRGDKSSTNTFSISSYTNPVGSSYTVPLTASYSAPAPKGVSKYSPSADDLERSSSSNVKTVYGKVVSDTKYDSQPRITNSNSKTLSSSYKTSPVVEVSSSYSKSSPASLSAPLTNSYKPASSSSSSSSSTDSVSSVDVAEERDGAGGHHHDHGHDHAHDHSAPPAAAAPVAAAPAPAETYQAAPVSTGNLYYYYYPVQEAPVHVVEKNDEEDLDPLVLILLPITVIIGLLALLSIINVTVVNGRSSGARSLDARQDSITSTFGSFSDLQDEVDRMLERYYDALESESCMDRIVCELGTKAKELSTKNLLLTALDWIIPSTMSQRTETFKEAVREGYSLEQCRKFHCDKQKIIDIVKKK